MTTVDEMLVMVNQSITTAVQEAATDAGYDIKDPKFEKFCESMRELIHKTLATKKNLDRIVANTERMNAAVNVIPRNPNVSPTDVAAMLKQGPGP